MSLSEKLESAWRTLEADGPKARLQRSLADLEVADSRMMLAVEDGCREIIFPADEANIAAAPPRLRGIEVVHRVEASSAEAKRLMVLRCMGAEFNAIFRRFTAAILEQVARSAAPARDALRALEEWREMFNRVGPKSPSMLLGLYGELHELREMTRLRPDAARAWRGPSNEPQDFISGKAALEVKTSRSRSVEVEVHGILQLWKAPLEELVVAAKHVVVAPTGESLGAIVREILDLGAPRQVVLDALELLDMPLASLGGSDLPLFEHRATRYFAVGADAPALTPALLKADLPSAVRSLRYRIALDGPGFRELQLPEVHALWTRFG